MYFHLDIQIFLQKKCQFADEGSQWSRSAEIMSKHKNRPSTMRRPSNKGVSADFRDKSSPVLSPRSSSGGQKSGIRVSPLASTDTLYLGKL
jgi:hypothetical protein